MPGPAVRGRGWGGRGWRGGGGGRARPVRERRRLLTGALSEPFPPAHLRRDLGRGPGLPARLTGVLDAPVRAPDRPRGGARWRRGAMAGASRAVRAVRAVPRIAHRAILRGREARGPRRGRASPRPCARRSDQGAALGSDEPPRSPGPAARPRSPAPQPRPAPVGRDRAAGPAVARSAAGPRGPASARSGPARALGPTSPQPREAPCSAPPSRASRASRDSRSMAIPAVRPCPSVETRMAKPTSAQSRASSQNSTWPAA